MRVHIDGSDGPQDGHQRLVVGFLGHVHQEAGPQTRPASGISPEAAAGVRVPAQWSGWSVWSNLLYPLQLLHLLYCRSLQVTKDRRFVVKQAEGELPERLQKCVIVDVKNWKCNETELDGLSVGFTDGKYAESYFGIPSAPSEAYVRHVSKSDWLSAQASPK